MMKENMMKENWKTFDTIVKSILGFVIVVAYALTFSFIFYGIGLKSEIPYVWLFFCYVALCVFYYLLTSRCFVSFFERLLKVKINTSFVSLIVYVLYFIIFAYSVLLRLHNMYNDIPFTEQSILIDTLLIPAFVTCISIDRVRDSMKKIRNTNS